MNENKLIQIINDQWQIAVPQNISDEELLQKVSEFINELINTDFEKLIQILYRADISEMKLKNLLKESPENAPRIIAKLIIEREKEKIHSRKYYSDKSDFTGEEKWN